MTGNVKVNSKIQESKEFRSETEAGNKKRKMEQHDIMISPTPANDQLTTKEKWRSNKKRKGPDQDFSDKKRKCTKQSDMCVQSSNSAKVTKSEKNKLYYEKNKERIKAKSRAAYSALEKRAALLTAKRESYNTKKQAKVNDTQVNSTYNANFAKAERNKLYYEKNKDKIKAKRKQPNNDSAGPLTSSQKLSRAEINKRYYERNKEKIKELRTKKYKDPVKRAAELAQKKAAYRDPVNHVRELARKQASYAIPEKRIAKLAGKRNFYKNPVNRALLRSKCKILYKKGLVKSSKVTKNRSVALDSDYAHLLNKARKAMLEMPVLACTVCHRARFKEQVKLCHRNKYPQTGLVLRCFTGKYIHQCSTDCNDSFIYHDMRKKEWICFTCHRHLLRGNMPPQAAVNNLWLDEIPEELKTLNALEMHLVSIVQPFMKIVPLPRGAQKGVRGQMVCVPANLQRTADSLPWTLNTNNLIRVKLKRKQEYKGHHLYMVVSQKRVMAALKKLMEINPAYQGKSILNFTV